MTKTEETKLTDYLEEYQKCKNIEFFDKAIEAYRNDMPFEQYLNLCLKGMWWILVKSN